MKELSEYKDEIFRRSAEKKRQITKRRRVALSVGIPLCLCCVITSVVLSGPTMGKNAKMEADRENLMCAENGMPERPMVAFRVEDPVDAAMVLGILQTGKPEYSVSKEELDREDSLADQTQLPEYCLTLQHPDGSTAIYRIQGQAVFCQTTGETLWLSEDQTRTLHTFLTQIDPSEKDTEHSFMARVLECGEGWVLVEPLEGETERNSSNKITFSTGTLEDIPVTVGTKVEITYDGQIMESYPAQIRPISWHLV